MNVLLTCAGRRNYLAQYFKQALNGRGKVFATDMSSDAPALQDADKSFLVPNVSDPQYFDVLRDICRQNKVRLLVSLNDLELPVLSRKRETFLAIGTIPVVSPPEFIDICFDKMKTVDFLRDNNLNAPKTFTSLEDAQSAISAGDLSFPLVVKPRWGTASIGIEYPQDKNELELTLQLAYKRIQRTILSEISKTDIDNSIMIQERLEGQEYGLDVVNDLNGNYVCTFAKRKLAMRAGETDKAVTVSDERLFAIGETIGKATGHIGNLDCDVFISDSGCYVLEMNPRFGGGYPFSQVAGANIPAALIAWANGEDPDNSWLTVKAGITSAKCDRLVIKKNTCTTSDGDQPPELTELSPGNSTTGASVNTNTSVNKSTNASSNINIELNTAANVRKAGK